MTTSFTAIDFETAQGYCWSICQVGLVRVENGLKTKELDLLVRPPDNFYWYQFTEIHGLNSQVTENAPTFADIWPVIEPYINNQIVVAHNGFAFDFVCLEQTLEYYKMPIPEYEKHCTYQLYRENLESLCTKYNIPLNHHDALSDARACAELFLKLNDKNLSLPEN
jgi:DNA polymerase-3 subunit epsilon